MRLSLFSTAFALVSTALSHCPPSSNSTAIQWAPLPPTAIGNVIPVTGYLTQHLGSGYYALLSGEYQSAFVVSDKGVIVIDCPPLLSMNCIYAIRNVTDIPVTHFIYSHAHGDHAAGAVFFNNSGVTFISHEETKYRIIDSLHKTVQVPLPTVTFEKDLTLTVGNQTLELSYKGSNHEPGNIFIYSKISKVLVLIDVVFPGWVPFGELSVSEYIPGWLESHAQILEYDFDYYIGGHVSRLGNRTDVKVQAEYLCDLQQISIDAINNSTTTAAAVLAPTIALNPGNSWAVTFAYGEYLTDLCEIPMNQRWVGRLGGADVYARQNCYTMIETLRLDYGILGPSGLRAPAVAPNALQCIALSKM